MLINVRDRRRTENKSISNYCWCKFCFLRYVDVSFRIGAKWVFAKRKWYLKIDRESNGDRGGGRRYWKERGFIREKRKERKKGGGRVCANKLNAKITIGSWFIGKKRSYFRVSVACDSRSDKILIKETYRGSSASASAPFPIPPPRHPWSVPHFRKTVTFSNQRSAVPDASIF